MEKLRSRLQEIARIGSLLNIALWDQEVNMPPKAADSRALALAEASGLLHQKFVSIDSDGLLSGLKAELDAGALSGGDAVVVRETWRSFEREKKLPERLVKEIALTASQAYEVWAEARKKDDFDMFLPWLRKMVKLKREEAEYVGYADSPYDALLDAYEPGMTSKEVTKVLSDLKGFLVPFIRKIKASKSKVDDRRLKGKFPIEAQESFNRLVAKEIGFDFAAGRLDKATHPFATGINPSDVRLTTRYLVEDVFYSIGSTVHEAGHGLYEQGLPGEHFGTPLAESVSLGIHESQSRMWENMIGKSEPFWRHFYPKLRKAFPKPFREIPLKDFCRMISKARPSLIRTESDEVTYNLHIILRYEIEKGMIEGTIDPADTPRIWKEKMKEYLGVDVPNDREGVLQDVHWAHGGIGYFPTYSLGNLYAAQFYRAMKKDVKGIERKMSQGDFMPVLTWLRKNIHSLGKTYRAGELVERVTGKPLDSRYFIEYLEEKYGRIYGL